MCNIFLPWIKCCSYCKLKRQNSDWKLKSHFTGNTQKKCHNKKNLQFPTKSALLRFRFLERILRRRDFSQKEWSSMKEGESISSLKMKRSYTLNSLFFLERLRRRKISNLKNKKTFEPSVFIYWHSKVFLMCCAKFFYLFLV